MQFFGSFPSLQYKVFNASISIKTKYFMEQGLYRGTQKNEMKLGICSRSNDVVEPMIKPQWFVDCKSMAKLSLDAVLSRDNKKIEIIPHQYEQEWKR